MLSDGLEIISRCVTRVSSSKDANPRRYLLDQGFCKVVSWDLFYFQYTLMIYWKLNLAGK